MKEGSGCTPLPSLAFNMWSVFSNYDNCQRDISLQVEFEVKELLFSICGFATLIYILCCGAAPIAIV